METVVGSSPLVKPKHRIWRSILVGSASGALLLLVSFAPLLSNWHERRLAFSRDTFFCTRCGLQSTTRTFWLFDYRITTSQKLPFEPLLPSESESCWHSPQKIGTRFFCVDLENFRTIRDTNGYPEGNSLYQNLTLVKALRTIARTNRSRAELLVYDLYRLRQMNIGVTNVLPSMKTGNVERLMTELRDRPFNEAVDESVLFLNGK